MLNLPFVGPEGYPVILDPTKIIAVHEIRSSRSGDAQCVIHLEGIGIGFQVNGRIEEVLAQIREASVIGPDGNRNDRIGRGELAPADESLWVSGKTYIPNPDEWRTMSKQARQEWDHRYRLSGMASFRCLTCHYPTLHGQSECVSCFPERFGKEQG